MIRRRAPRRPRRTRARAEIQAVVDETIALFHWLGWVADQIYGDDLRGAPRRWILRRLQRHGPQTVPQLARAKALCRQSMQPVVDALAADGCVARIVNAAHRRSKLVALTARGERLVEHMDRIDARVLRAVSSGLTTHQLVTTSATLRALREHFAIEARWRTAIAAA